MDRHAGRGIKEVESLDLFNNIVGVSDYALLQNLPGFFREINRISGDYAYVSVTERRCFNLTARFLPELDMISSSALKLCCGKIAKFYRDNARLPKILILDDVMVRGRSIAKLLAQLESLLEEELRDSLVTPEELSRFHSSFTDAVDIYVYAKNRGTLFLSKRFQRKLRFTMELYAGRLRDLTLQMSYWLKQQEIANTSFVCSVRSKLLTDLLENGEEKADGPWKRTVWKYRGECMIAYHRVYGTTMVNRLSTLRFFPERAKRHPPQVTSFTVFGDLELGAFSELCLRVARALQEMDCPELSAVLRAQKTIIRINQGQLLCYILSILDLFEFFRSVLTEQQYQQMEEELRIDLNKIACQFGRRSEVRRELARIAGNVVLRDYLEGAVSQWVTEHAAPIAPVGAEVCETAQTAYSEEEIWNIGEHSERIFYQIGWQGEEKAAQLNQEPEQFRPDRYQNYDQPDEYGDHGVISLYDYFKLCQKEETLFQRYFYGYLNAFIAMMDHSVLSVRMSVVGQDTEKLSILSKAGELSAFYVPRKLALLVPALAQVEYRSFALEAEAKTREAVRFIRAVCDVCQQYCLTEFSETDMSRIRTILQQQFAPEKIQEEIANVYRCGQSFYGWNFPNLTALSHPIDQKFQKYVKQEFEVFLTFAEEGTIPLHKGVVCTDTEEF